MTQKLIDKELFISLWKGDLIDNEEYAEFYKTTYNVHGDEQNEVVINNVKINTPIYLENIPKGYLPIRIVNSTIKFLNISNSIFNSIKFEENATIVKLYIQEKSNIEELFISNNTVLTEFEISTSSTVENLLIDKECKIDILNICGKETKVNTLGISNTNFKRLYVEDNATVLDLIIKGGSRINDLTLKDYSSFDNILISANTMCFNFFSKSIIVKQNIEISNSFFKTFSFHTKEMVNINFTNSFIQDFEYKNDTSSILNLRNCKIMLFLLKEMRTGKDGLIQILDCHISKLKFDTLFNLSSINIRRLEPFTSGKKFKNSITEEDPYEMIEFSNEKTAIIILDSDIGRTLFSSDLSKFEKFEFRDSKIIDSFIAGPRLPKISTTDNSDIKLLLDQQRIAYNQIKKIYETRGDNITAMDYLAKEMEVYRKQVINKQDGRIPGESFQLKFNQFTNQHGTEWTKPLLWAIVISLGFYIAYYCFLFGFNWGGSFDYNAIPYYFEFLNPLHKTDFIKKFDFSSNSKWDNFALSCDYLSRLVIPLFLYQMIQAFRKYGKK